MITPQEFAKLQKEAQERNISIEELLQEKISSEQSSRVADGNENFFGEPNQIPSNDVSPKVEKVSPSNSTNQEEDKPYSGAIPVVNDTSTPIALFVGPSGSGKSMVLVSLAKFFHENGFVITPNRDFVNNPNYIKDCNEFDKKYSADNGKAVDGTTGFMLVDIYKGKNKKLQLLEAPGEDYISFRNPQKEMPLYLAKILGMPNKKIWIMMLDLHSEYNLAADTQKRNQYETKLQFYFDSYVNKDRDSVFLLYNQIDAHDPKFGTYTQIIDEEGAKTYVRSMYKNVHANFTKTKYLQTSPFYKDIVYCTGWYGKDKSYTACASLYPKKLYDEITRKW